MIFSYDIFDTIICRYVPRPTDIFNVVEYDPEVKALWPKGLDGFSKYRQASEFWARRKLGRCVTIEQIYTELTKRTGIDNETAARIMTCELKIEKEWSYLNKKVVDEIVTHIKQNEKVVLISDMYWHENQIRDWLTGKNDVFSLIPIYISCDCRVSKADGKLFNWVKEQEGVDFEDWTHTGDNKKSDGIIPRSLGINSVVVLGARRYDFESRIDSRNLNMLYTYRMITTARRSSNGDAFDMGASIAGPLVYQYVDWVITQAMEKHFSKLYFVLRDGYILKKVADEIIQNRKLPLETAFLFGSRVAWRFPELTVEKLRNLSVWEKSNWIFRDPAFTYVPFERLGFLKEETISLFGTEFAERVLQTFSEFKSALSIALSNPIFVQKLEQKINEASANLDEYLMSTIEWDKSFALVDTNSTGKTQADLNSFLRRRHTNCKKLPFFYHTFLDDRQPNPDTQFVFVDAENADRRFPEAFFRAPYNQCYGYKKTSSGIKPFIHKSDYCAWYGSFDYESYLAGIIALTHEFENHRCERLVIDKYTQLLLKVVNFDIPCKKEIELSAKIPFNPDLNGDESLDFYPEIHLSNLFHPFKELIYFPKGSYYKAGSGWPIIYRFLLLFVKMKRSLSKK